MSVAAETRRAIVNPWIPERMTSTKQPSGRLRLRARDNEETAIMEATLSAFRIMRARQRIAGSPRISQAVKAAHEDVVMRMKDVFPTFLEAASQAAYLRLVQKAIGAVSDDIRCADLVWGLNTVLATLCATGGGQLAVDAGMFRIAAGGTIHSDFAAVSRLVRLFCGNLRAHFPPESLALGSPLLEAAKLVKEFLTVETADAVIGGPGLGMQELLDSVIRDNSPDAVEVLRLGILIPELDEDRRRVGVELKRLVAEHEHLTSRETRSARWTMDPLASFGLTRPEKIASDRDFLDTLLYIFRNFSGPNRHSTEDLANLVSELAHHEALLRWWLPRIFSPEDDIQFAPAHLRVIEALVVSPRRFLRLNCAPEVIAYRRRLRPLIPFFEGYHPTVEQPALVKALRAPEATLYNILDLLVPYLRSRIEARTCIDILECVMTGVDCLLSELPETIEGTVLVRHFAHLRNAEDVAFEKLMTEDAAAAGMQDEVVQPPVESLPAELEFAVLAEPEEITPVDFEMLETPGSARTRSVRLSTTRARMVDDLSDLIEKQGKVIVPPRSVARAIYHYLFEISGSIRNTWNKESLRGFSWHKIKRGRCRIYVRSAGDTVCFSVINRRDWVHGDAIGRRI